MWCIKVCYVTHKPGSIFPTLFHITNKYNRLGYVPYKIEKNPLEINFMWSGFNLAGTILHPKQSMGSWEVIPLGVVPNRKNNPKKMKSLSHLPHGV